MVGDTCTDSEQWVPHLQCTKQGDEVHNSLLHSHSISNHQFHSHTFTLSFLLPSYIVLFFQGGLLLIFYYWCTYRPFYYLIDFLFLYRHKNPPALLIVSVQEIGSPDKIHDIKLNFNFRETRNNIFSTEVAGVTFGVCIFRVICISVYLGILYFPKIW